MKLENNKEEDKQIKDDAKLNSEERISQLEKELKDLKEKIINLESLNKNKEVIKSKKNFKKVIGEFLFYTFLIILIAIVFLLRSNSEGKPISFAGYSIFTVLTGSMQSEIPKGSFVITKHIAPENLKIGDDITYMANETTTITHRIITIVEKYQDTGKRAFETKGIMNDKPDKNLVLSSNVVGKVVFHSKLLGDISHFINKNWPFLIFVLVVIWLSSSILKKILNHDEKDKEIFLKNQNGKFKKKNKKMEEGEKNE